MYEFSEVRKYLLWHFGAEISDNRIKQCYDLISNPAMRVNSDDKKWVAYTSQASENVTVVEAIRIILIDNLPSTQLPLQFEIESAVNTVGELFEEQSIRNKPRIPFYVLVLNKLI